MNKRKLIFYLVTIAAIVLVYLKFSELRLIQEFFHGSNGGYLALVVGIQFFIFLFQAINYHVILTMKGLVVPIRELFPVSFVIQFISQAIPTAGISGQVFLIQYLKKYGFTLAEGIGRAILELATLYVAYLLYFAISVSLLFHRNVFTQEPRFMFFIYAFLMFALVCAIIVVLSQKKDHSSFRWILDRIGAIFKKGGIAELEMIKEQFHETLGWYNLKLQKWAFLQACFWQAVLLLCHVMTLYVIAISLGHPIPLVACFVAFTFSKFLSMVSIIPGAPGVFEGAMTLILISFGVDKSVALAATLLTRAFTFWLPMPIGWLLYGRYLRKFEQQEDKLVVS